MTHYFHHHAWLADGILLREAGRLAGIPGVLVHGRLDLGGPPVTAWELAHAWPDAELHLVSTGHLGGPDRAAHLIAARLVWLSRPAAAWIPRARSRPAWEVTSPDSVSTSGLALDQLAGSIDRAMFVELSRIIGAQAW